LIVSDHERQTETTFDLMQSCVCLVEIRRQKNLSVTIHIGVLMYMYTKKM